MPELKIKKRNGRNGMEDAVEDFSNGLTKAETERLSLLVEECSEVIQAATKILRHGYESLNPDNPAHAGNRSDLEDEIGHVVFAVSMLVRNGDVKPLHIEQSAAFKVKKVRRYLHHNEAVQGDFVVGVRPSKKERIVTIFQNGLACLLNVPEDMDIDKENAAYAVYPSSAPITFGQWLIFRGAKLIPCEVIYAG